MSKVGLEEERILKKIMGIAINHICEAPPWKPISHFFGYFNKLPQTSNNNNHNNNNDSNNSTNNQNEADDYIDNRSSSNDDFILNEIVNLTHQSDNIMEEGNSPQTL